ncbi:MAG TPA: hypothetical protein VFU06_04380 [Longimicrobiales bacterium]|nr:hypothetical protein [Longimicrobiales bacterium]
MNATSTAVLACDLTRTMIADVRSWFPQPERRDAQETVRSLADACTVGNTTLVTELAVALLGSMEALADAGRGGDALVGSRLANALLACTSGEGCTAAALPDIDLSAALSLPAGLFRIYTGDMAAPAIARGLVPFVDFDGNQNAALFGVELSGGWSWTAANGGTPLVLLYGAPVVEGGLDLLEPGFGGLQYDVKRWPRPGPFVGDDIVHVGACFTSEVTLPHDHETNESAQPRMQREGTLLSAYSPTFCPPGDVPQQASLLGPIATLTRSVLPARWLAMLSDVRTPRVGGSALDFSRFAPVAADAEGRLEMLSGPASVATLGQSIGTIVIRALSGGGTPMERVRVTLYVFGNSGVPAGAVLVGDPSGYTIENDGTVAIAGLTINKTGGYTICARGELSGFTFSEACSGLFHVRR